MNNDKLGRNGIRGIYFNARVIAYITAGWTVFMGVVALIAGHELLGLGFFGLVVIFCLPHFLANKPLPFNGSFICPHCLKTIEVNKVEFACPFCETQYTNDPAALLDKCQNKACNAVIRYIDCYYCHEVIDLFAPYDRKELEAKRYE